MRAIAVAMLHLAVASPALLRAQSASMPPAREGFLTTADGTRLWYSERGSGEPALVIPFASHLSLDLQPLARGRHLVFYDMRGRGRSDLLLDSTRIGMREDIADLEALRAHLGIQRLQLLGYSYLGAMVVLYAIEHPDRVERIVQVGPVPPRRPAPYEGARSPRDTWQRDTAAFTRLVARNRAGDFANDRPGLCREYYRITSPGLFGTPEGAARHRTAVDMCTLPTEQPEQLGFHFTHHIASQGAQFDHREAARALTIPVLTLHGTFDRNAPYEGGRDWARTLPNARLITVEGAAHQLFNDHPEIFFPAVDAFLRGTWPKEAQTIR